MPGILEHAGVFQVPVGDGWSTRGKLDSYALTHEHLDVSVHISIYPRSAVSDDPVEAVLGVARSAGAATDRSSVVVPTGDLDHRRAFLRFREVDSDTLVVFLYVRSSAVLAISSAPVGDEAAFAAGEQVVAAICPHATARPLD